MKWPTRFVRGLFVALLIGASVAPVDAADEGGQPSKGKVLVYDYSPASRGWFVEQSGARRAGPFAVRRGSDFRLRVDNVNRYVYDVAIKVDEVNRFLEMPGALTDVLMPKSKKSDATKPANAKTDSDPEWVKKLKELDDAVEDYLFIAAMDERMEAILKSEPALDSDAKSRITTAVGEVVRTSLGSPDSSVAVALATLNAKERQAETLYAEIAELLSGAEKSLRQTRDDDQKKAEAELLAAPSAEQRAIKLQDYRNADEDYKRDTAKLDAVSAAAKAEIEKLRGVVSKGTAQPKVRRAYRIRGTVLSQEAFTVWGESRTAKGDELNCEVRITAKSGEEVFAVTPSTAGKGKEGESPTPAASPAQRTVAVEGGIKIDFSPGVIFSNLNDEKFSKGNKGGTAVIRKASDQNFGTAFGGLMHIYRPSRGYLQPALSFGASAQDGKQVQYLLGGSLLVGRERRFIFTAGLSAGSVRRLRPGLSVGGRFPAAEADVTEDRFGTGLFFGITYNLN